MANDYGKIVKVLLDTPMKPTVAYAGWDRRDFWLAQAVVDLVEERAVNMRRDHRVLHPVRYLSGSNKCALCNWPINGWDIGAIEALSIDPADYAELKRRLGK